MTDKTLRDRDIKRLGRLESRLAKIEAAVGLAPAKPDYGHDILAIQRRVAEEFNVGVGVITGPSRYAVAVQPRQIAMYLAYNLIPEISYQEIGNAFGGRHHTTVMYSIEKVHDSRKQDKMVNQLIAALSMELQSVEAIEKEIGL